MSMSTSGPPSPSSFAPTTRQRASNVEEPAVCSSSSSSLSSSCNVNGIHVESAAVGSSGRDVCPEGCSVAGISSLMDQGDRKEPEGAVDPKEATDEYQEALLRKSKRDAQLMWNYLLLCMGVVSSWVLGHCGFSVAWVVVLLGGMFVVWHGTFTQLIKDVVLFEKLRVQKRRALQNDESAEWLNLLINRWWIFSSQTIFTFLKASLDPLLNESKPNFIDSIELLEFTLGDGTPTISSVKAFDVCGGVHRPLNMASTVGKALLGGSAARRGQIALQVAVDLHCPDYRMVLHTRLGGKGVGVDLDIAMEKLNISGKLSLILSMNMDCSFPHISKMTFSFLEKPEVWFSLRVLKAVQMMEVPGLKTWVHSVVMEALTTALVDPGKVDLNLSTPESLIPSSQSSNSLAQGVLTITLSRLQQQLGKILSGDEERWCVLRLGNQRQVTSKVSSSKWQDCRSFLVENVGTDRICVKVKSKRLISTMNVAQFEIPLGNYIFDGNRVVDTTLQKKTPKGSTGEPGFHLRMEYTPLKSIHAQTEKEDPVQPKVTNVLAGVMYVCIHSAEGLLATDKNKIPNPYCIVFYNRKKLKTTHYICRSTNPNWEASIEFLVSDYLQTVISFAICSWDINKMSDADLMGLGSFVMSQNETSIWKRKIPLTFNMSGNMPDNKAIGTITISAVFRPVASVAESDFTQLSFPLASGHEEEDSRSFKIKRGTTGNFMQTAKMLLTNTKETDTSGSLDFGDILSSGSGLMELTVVKARDLVAKDLNGFSDPYCEVKINNECKFKTSCRKKTLHPVWDESVTMQLPKVTDKLSVIMWDRDPLGMRDFMGSVTLTLSEIRQYSSKELAEWFPLQETESGQIELKLKIISEDFESQDSDSVHLVYTEKMMGSPGNSPSFATTTAPSSVELNANQSLNSPVTRRKLPIAVPTPIVPLAREVQEAKSADNNKQTEGKPNPNRSPVTLDSPVATATECLVSASSHTGLSVTDTLPVMSQLALPNEPSEASKSSSTSPKYENAKGNGLRSTAEYSSIRSMKQKVKHGLTHPLRRFRSEVNVHESKTKALQERVIVEPQDTSQALSSFDSLPQAKSQPDISTLVPVSIDIDSAEKKTRYYNLQGKIIQGVGFKAHQSLMYCRIKLIRTFDKRSKSIAGKTVCKSAPVPASINPHFDTEFQIDGTGGVLHTAALIFDVRTEKKETIATKTVKLQELFPDCAAETAEVQEWFTLSNGAKLEIELSHGKPIDKKAGGAMKLFRSWSVHRIGKV